MQSRRPDGASRTRVLPNRTIAASLNRMLSSQLRWNGIRHAGMESLRCGESERLQSQFLPA